MFVSTIDSTGHVPTISRFYGIVVQMYHDDHNPPNIHAVYGDDEALFGIHDLALLLVQIEPLK